MKKKSTRLALRKETVLDLSAANISVQGGVSPTDPFVCELRIVGLS